jgi:BolA protein
MNNAERIQRMRERLEQALTPEHLSIEDESHLHKGHAGARDGRGHFRLSMVAEAFNGKRGMQRHRMVYQALGDMMQTDIHALSIEAISKEEL